MVLPGMVGCRYKVFQACGLHFGVMAPVIFLSRISENP